MTVQERIAESERRREHKPSPPAVKQALTKAMNRIPTVKSEQRIGITSCGREWNKVDKVNSKLSASPIDTKKITVSPIIQLDRRPKSINILSQDYKQENSMIPVSNPSVVTTIISEASTITIPIHTTCLTTQALPKYKTMPSPTRVICNPTLNPPQLTLNEIFEESDGHIDSNIRHTSRQFVSRNQTRTNYEQRRSKFHKNRTASCSSSDASDDDSESRKKRAHKLNNNGKPLPGRRDSHDDSSDSQDQGGSGGTGGGSGHVSGQVSRRTEGPSNTGSKTDTRNGNSTHTTGGRKNQGNQQVMLGRRHRTGRRRNGETRLRESQSLNRISEVQEDQAHNFVISATLTTQSHTCTTPKFKNFGARILQGWSLNSKRNSPVDHENKKLQKDSSPKDPVQSVCSKKSTESDFEDATAIKKTEEKENYSKVLSDKTGSKKMRLLGKYFQVHKKICIPLPGLFGKNRLHKTQSCSSLIKDRITTSTIDSVVFCGEVMKTLPKNDTKNKIETGSDINQNLGSKSTNLKSGPIVQLNSVCSGIGGICSLHLGDASKCCSLC